jgi:hypothetical protein
MLLSGKHSRFAHQGDGSAIVNGELDAEIKNSIKSLEK